MSRCRSTTQTDLASGRVTCQGEKGHKTHKANVGKYTIWWGDGKRAVMRTKR